MCICTLCFHSADQLAATCTFCCAYMTCAACSQVYDVRAIAAAAEAQRLEIKWDNTSVHFLPVAYEQFNDLLLNTICNRQLFEPGT